MKRLSIEGTDYACPFWDIVRPHTAIELSNLRGSIRKRGRITTPILTYYSIHHGYAIIDGQTRTSIGLEFGFEIPISFVKSITDEEARELAIDGNWARRHLTPEEQKELRAERLDLIEESIIENPDLTLRQLAAAFNVSPEQIRRDLEEIYKRERKPKKLRDKPKKKTLQFQAHNAGRKLTRTVSRILSQAEKRKRFSELAASYGVPLEADGRTWPALVSVLAVIRDLG